MTKRNLFWWTCGAVWGTLMLKPLITNLINNCKRKPKDTTNNNNGEWVEVPFTKED